MKPVAGLAKAIISTVTLGEPLSINFDPTGLVKNFAYFTWRTGFPVSMPKGFIQKAQDFYNRIKLRVDRSEVAEVERKSLASLKLDLDEIVDGIVEEVRQSPDGLYTDYLRTRIDGVPLEDACTAVGVQLKAYGVDLTNYRNIAGMVLGIPVMPTVASTMVNVAHLVRLDAVRNLTRALNPLNASSSGGQLLAGLPANALQSVSSVSNSALNSIGSFGQQLPVQNLVQSARAPLNLFHQQPALA